MSSPSAGVLRAFGVDGPARPLTGGQGTSWLAGSVVLKRDPAPCQEWLGTVLTEVQATDVRIALPVPSRRSAWRYEGWSATRWVEGVPPDHASATVWLEVLEAGRAFHRAVAHLSRPGCLDRRSDPWAEADRAAWGERRLDVHPAFAAVAARVADALEPLGPSQLVHGDLAGNVLFAPGRPPAVIDLSPYWRPPAYAEGIVLADALCWHGAPQSLLREAGVPVAAVARGLLFRMLTTSRRVEEGDVAEEAVDDEARRYDHAVSAVGL